MSYTNRALLTPYRVVISPSGSILDTRSELDLERGGSGWNYIMGNTVVAENLNQRVWVLEQKVEDLEEIKANQKMLLAEFQRFKGFVGGVLFVGGCLAVVFQPLFSHVLSWLRG